MRGGFCARVLMHRSVPQSWTHSVPGPHTRITPLAAPSKKPTRPTVAETAIPPANRCSYERGDLSSTVGADLLNILSGFSCEFFEEALGLLHCATARKTFEQASGANGLLWLSGSKAGPAGPRREDAQTGRIG